MKGGGDHADHGDRDSRCDYDAVLPALCPDGTGGVIT